MTPDAARHGPSSIPSLSPEIVNLEEEHDISIINSLLLISLKMFVFLRTPFATFTRKAFSTREANVAKFALPSNEAARR